MASNGVPNGNGVPYPPNMPMENTGMVDVSYFSKFSVFSIIQLT